MPNVIAELTTNARRDYIIRMALNPTASSVLKFLAGEYSEDFGCFGFAGIMEGTGINDRKAIRRACRLLARKGFAEFHKCLWSEDGKPRGAGYGATKAGVEAALCDAAGIKLEK